MVFLHYELSRKLAVLLHRQSLKYKAKAD